MNQRPMAAVLVAAVLLTGCTPVEETPVAHTVSGTLVFPEQAVLTPGAVATVSLQDVSLADAPSRTLAETRLPDPDPGAATFELEYDPAAIDQRMSYGLRAQVHDGGRLVYTSDTHYPVLTRGAGNTAEIVLVAVTPRKAKPLSPAEGEPRGMHLTGMFRYMADAAMFEDCRTRRTYPVSMEGAYIELEKAYSNSGIEPGSPLLVDLRGRYLERPAMEGNRNIVSLIVDSFNKIHPDKPCMPPVDEPLRNTYWKLLEVGGEPVTVPAGRKEAHMILRADGGQAGGNAGCNTFFGRYETNGSALSFGAVGATLMSCPDGMDTERAFLAALENTDRYAISGLILTLYRGEEPLAKFEAVHLP